MTTTGAPDSIKNRSVCEQKTSLPRTFLTVRCRSHLSYIIQSNLGRVSTQLDTKHNTFLRGLLLFSSGNEKLGWS
jgi:hypothetical protein